MNQSENINELAGALAMAQGSFPILEKRSKAYNYNYADLAEILGAIQSPLKENGLAIVSQTTVNGITAKVIHSSGQWMSTEVPLIFKEDGKINAMQAMGSAITYARRYAICCLLNLAADKESDDDGVSALPKPSAPKESSTFPNAAGFKITQKQAGAIQGWARSYPLEMEDMLKDLGVEAIEDILFKDCQRVFDNFKKLDSKNVRSA